MSKNLFKTYDEKFYEYNIPGSLRSAKVFLNIIKDRYKFGSVVDFGCGRGTWLKAALDIGATTVYGYDGPWNEGKLIDDKITFSSKDLSNLEIGSKKFDLAISLEVAEHLPENSSDQFIDAITSSSDLVMFGSAFTRQIGTNHINEQLPSYWANKFIERGFYPVDLFRKNVWFDQNIEPCYRQNTFLYVKETNTELAEIFKKDLIGNQIDFMNCMHPDIYLKRSGRDLISDFIYGMKIVIASKLRLK